MFKKAVILSTLAIVFLGACATRQETPSLYERLGGRPALAAVVDDAISRISLDPRINHFFADSDIPDLKEQLLDQLCELSGGPCVYGGRDMLAAHVGMGIQQADFDAMVEDLVLALNAFNVPEAEQLELLALLAPMQDDIVE